MIRDGFPGAEFALSGLVDVNISERQVRLVDMTDSVGSKPRAVKEQLDYLHYNAA